MSIDQSAIGNVLLRRLSPEDFALLAPHLSFRSADRGTILFRPNRKAETAWFIDSGIGSIITVSPQGRRIESGLFGRDGFAPVALVMGSDRSPHEAVIQVCGDCHTIPADRLREAAAASATLRELLLRYAQTLAVQTSYTALSNAVQSVEERLARWILMCHDRSDSDALPLTHEYLSIMLSVRRPSVTTAIHVLEGNRLIRSERGLLVVRDRAGLIEFAEDLYGPPEAEYERLICRLRR